MKQKEPNMSCTVKNLVKYHHVIDATDNLKILETRKITFFGEEAKFFLNANRPQIQKVEKLDRERLTVVVTFDDVEKNE